MSITRRDDKTTMKKQTSRTKLDRSIRIESELPHTLIIPTTTQETKNAPPSTLLRPTSPEPDRKETMLAKTSGEPLPRERSVTPAMVGESLRTLDKFSTEEQKY